MRLTSLPRERILALFSRLSSLGFIVRIYKIKTPWSKAKGLIEKKNEAVEIKYYPRAVGLSGNYTFFLYGLFDCVARQACEKCRLKAFENIDFSLLSSMAGFPEKIKR